MAAEGTVESTPPAQTARDEREVQAKAERATEREEGMTLPVVSSRRSTREEAPAALSPPAKATNELLIQAAARERRAEERTGVVPEANVLVVGSKTSTRDKKLLASLFVELEPPAT